MGNHIERLIESGYRFLMPGAPRSFSGFEQDFNLAQRGSSCRGRPQRKEVATSVRVCVDVIANDVYNSLIREILRGC